MASHTERALEDIIEEHLTQRAGWRKGSQAEYDVGRALFPSEWFRFIEDTQPRLWAELRKQHGAGLEAALLDTLERTLDSHGMLEVLRHGLKFFGRKVECAYFKPANRLNPDTWALYAQNQLSVTRQLHFIEDAKDSLDLVLSLNGLPVATVELKNHLTGQTASDAVYQYQRRDPRQKLFQFKKRALVHFAVDPEQVFTSTRLAGKETTFLPFNRGHDLGAGNPPHPSGIRTGYLWEEVWARDSFLDIVGRFLHLLEVERWSGGKLEKKESLIFPRYHQLDVVRRVEDSVLSGSGPRSYLIQHSAGSGKSNSIAWLAHRLSSLHGADDARLFDSVVVITDRKVLDKQLQDTIYQFEHKGGVVARIDDDSAQLAEALKKGTPVVITTLQKFPFVTEKIGELPKRRYALIVDEAHSSQTGEAAQKMKRVLGVDAEEGEEPTYEDEMAEVMKSRGPQKNLTFFAFTATPKYKTLTIFGIPGPDGKPRPFHLYSMRQAIEEGFILDVLRNYTTYKRFFQLVKKVADDPEVPQKEALGALGRFVSLHPVNVAQKTEIIVEHFRSVVRPRLGGKAKAMVVAASRLMAVRYKQAFDRYVQEKGYSDVHTLVAFSGVVSEETTEQTYTEPAMNKGISERELPERFASDDFNVLIVANKYQTGFDQPLLAAMYVDKRLDGVQAVQTLSRLNRTHPGKEETFILDFVNEAEAIREAFQPYYEQTLLGEAADPHKLYELQHELDSAQVYLQVEVENFCKAFYSPKKRSDDLSELYRHLDPAVDRFKALNDKDREEFRTRLGAFVRLYAFLAQVMPFSDPDLEKRYAFGRYLERRLPREKGEGFRLDGEVALQYYRLEKTFEQSLQLKAGEGGVVYGPTSVGTGKANEEKVKLSSIIDVLNEHFGTNFSSGNLVLDQVADETAQDPQARQKAYANEFDNFALAIGKDLEGRIIDRIEENAALVTRFTDDPEFKAVALKEMARRIYEQVRGPAAQMTSPNSTPPAGSR